jgi:DNA polymerase (family 10)
MKNSAVAGIFRNIAELLEIKGDNPFRIRAYLRAAENIENLSQDIEDYAVEGRLREIPGIGRDLSDKIDEILGEGKCKYYEELKKIVPEGVVQMLQVPSIGPKAAKLFFDELKLKTVDELEQAAKAGRLLGLPGIREKTVENILKGIELRKKARERMDLLTATSVAESVTSRIKKIKGVIRIFWAGSLRRMKETVRDVDILVASKNAKKIIEAFISLPQTKRVLAQGETKSSILTSEDVQVDLRVLEAKSFGAALLYFTGSKNHNIKLRQLAIKQRLKINEYGVFDKAGRCRASKTEEEMYRALGLDYIAPELREDTGEVEASQNHALPKLLELKDIRGDFHSHTSYSDGKDTVEAMARKAISLGYEYLCLTDHSVSLRVANGLDIPRLMKKKKEIDRLNKKLRNIRILFGTEVEIDSKGQTDYKDDVLSLFDLVVAAIHSGFKQSKRQLTQRIVRACQNKYVHIIAHPTGKLRMARDSYELDFKEVFKAAEETNTALEINAHPFRLDLSDVHARWAKESKVRLAISTDSHAIEHLDYMKFGVGLGRRAWLRKEDVLNSLRLAELVEAIKK